jgi:hypothetical protein
VKKTMLGDKLRPCVTEGGEMKVITRETQELRSVGGGVFNSEWL